VVDLAAAVVQELEQAALVLVSGTILQTNQH